MGEGMSLRCAACAAPIQERAVDPALGVAPCGACGALLDLASRPGVLPPRPPDPVPQGIREEAGEDGLRIRWSSLWDRPRVHWILVLLGLPAFTCLLGAVGGFTGDGRPKPWGLVVAAVVLAWFGLGAVFNRTTVRADGSWVAAGTGPLSLRRPRRFAARDVRQVHCVGRSRVDIMEKEVRDYDVRVVLADGTSAVLLRTSDLARALFVERRLEARLRLADRAAAFEAGGARPSAASADRVACASCGAPLDVAAADRATGTVRCRSCGVLAALGERAARQASPLAGIPVPERFTATFDGGVLRVRWRWFHGTNTFLLLLKVLFNPVLVLVLLGLVAALLTASWITAVAGGLGIVAILWCWAASLVNRSDLVADATSLRVRYGPIPLPPVLWFPRNVVLGRASMSWIGCESQGSGKNQPTNRYAVIVRTIQGKPREIGESLEREEATFLVDALRRLMFRDAPLSRE